MAVAPSPAPDVSKTTCDKGTCRSPRGSVCERLGRTSLPNAALLLIKLPLRQTVFGEIMRNKALLLASAVLCGSNVPANALSWSTQTNCASDYYAYCSMHTAGSAGCHACMRANRAKLSKSCVSALIDDGVLTKANASPRQTKTTAAPTKAKVASRVPSRREANPVAKVPSAKAAETALAKESADAALPTHPEPLKRAPEPPAPPPQQLVQAAPAIDQETFEALKSRAPYFLPADDIASIFSRAQ